MCVMPCTCPGCGDVVELTDALRDPYGPTGTELVCPDCAEERRSTLDAEEA